MRHTKLLSTVAIFCLSSFAAVGAYSQTWDFTTSNGSPPCSVSAPCGTVTLAVAGDGSSATFTITSLVTDTVANPTGGFVFSTFGFNAESGGSVLALTGVTLDTSKNQDGYGNYDYIFSTGKKGADGATCLITGVGCSVSFTVDGTNLTAADFEITSSGNSGSGFFAGHLVDSSNNGATGFVGSTQSVSVTTFSVPEGASVPMLGVAALALLGTMSFKKRSFFVY